jgi:hypothetical protein
MSQENYPYYSDEQTVPETPDPGSAPKPWGKTSMVGRRQPRVDGYEIVSGRAVYPSDISLPGMLFGAVLRCPYPNAVVKSLDTRAAEKMPGVQAVLMGMSYTVLMPIFAKDILHGGPHTLGFLMAVSGIGALAGSIYLASRQTILGLGRFIASASAIFGIGLIAFSISKILIVSLFMMFITRRKEK